MKQIYITILLAISLFGTQAQIDCSTGRFDQPIFQNVDITSNIVYGNAVNYQNQAMDLKMDIYQPQGDTMQQRPLIIFAFGGSFIAGDKNLPDVTRLCTEFAKRGYVTASIQYRLGITIDFTSIVQNALAAATRASQDMKAAVRFFRKDKAGNNLYKINENKIIVGGVSAGGFAALQTAYFDKESEAPILLDLNGLGGLEGNSGNPGFSSEVYAVVNLSGALGRADWIEPGDVPLVTLHGNQDEVVPYGHGFVKLGGFNIIEVDGGKPIHERAIDLGIQSELYTFYNQLHVPFTSHAGGSSMVNLYMDTTIQFVSNFLYKLEGCTPSNPNPIANQPIDPLSIKKYNVSQSFEVYPNPSADFIRLKTNDSQFENINYEMLDLTGKKLAEGNAKASDFNIDLKAYETGVYVLKIAKNNQIENYKIVKQ